MKTEKQKKKDTYFPKRKYALKDWVNQKRFCLALKNWLKMFWTSLIEYLLQIFVVLSEDNPAFQSSFCCVIIEFGSLTTILC